MSDLSVNSIGQGTPSTSYSTNTTSTHVAPWEEDFANVLKKGKDGHVDISTVSVFAPYRPVHCAEGN